MKIADPSMVEPTLRELKKNFETDMTKSAEFRKDQLRQLIRGC